MTFARLARPISNRQMSGGTDAQSFRVGGGHVLALALEPCPPAMYVHGTCPVTPVTAPSFDHDAACILLASPACTLFSTSLNSDKPPSTALNSQEQKNSEDVSRCPQTWLERIAGRPSCQTVRGRDLTVTVARSAWSSFSASVPNVFSTVSVMP